MRALALAAVVAAVLAACTGDGGTDGGTPSPTPSATGPTSPATGPTSSVTGATTVTPSLLRLPEDTPSVVDAAGDVRAIASGDLAALAPPEARVAHRSVLATPRDPLDQIAVAWIRGRDPFASEHGFIVWQWFEGVDAWRAVYAFTDPAGKGVLGIAPLRSGDLTRDGIDELVTFEDVGGSGACGITRVISPVPGTADEIFRHRACDTEIALGGGVLELREAVYEPDDAHCCPSAYRFSTLRWDGSAFVETDSRTEPT